MPVHGEELWKSNGTNAGTVLVKHITPGASRQFLLRPCRSGRTIFFAADDNIHGQGCGSRTAPTLGHRPRQGHQPGRSTTTAPCSLRPDCCRREACSSPPTTASTAGSRGRRTAAPPAPPWSRTSGHAAPAASATLLFTPLGGTVFFAADDGVHGRGAVEDRTAVRSGTVLAQGHQPLFSTSPVPSQFGPTSLALCGRDVVLRRTTTAPTAWSCGSRTARGRAPSWSRTSMRCRTANTRPRGQ